MRWLAALVLTGHLAEKVAPYSGAPFLTDQDLAALPSHFIDGEDPNTMVQRLIPNLVNRGPPTACDLGKQAGKDVCLANKDRECMWIRTEGNDPLAPVQAVESVCLPCSLDGEDLPCWNVGAFVGGKRVTDCEMSCPHQKRIRQPEYACVDESGFITQAQCFDKGVRSGSKCMWLAYEDADGVQKSTCAPCHVSGTGGWGCPASGADGPVSGSKVTGCLDQCTVICTGPPGCPPTVAPPPPPPPLSPGVVMTTLKDPDEMLIAPAPVSMPTVNPYAIAQAAMEAAKKAGWAIGTLPPPKVYDPVLMYRSPMDYQFTPGPPPAMLGAPAPPGAFLQKIAEEANVASSSAQRKSRSLLQRLRHSLTK